MGPSVALRLFLVALAGLSRCAHGIELNNEESLRKAVNRSPKDPHLRVKLAKWHLQWGELRKALDALKAGLTSDPVNAWQFQEMMGDVHLTWSKDERAAASHFKEALALNPKARRSVLQYGMLRTWQGQREEAKTLFEQAVSAGLLADPRQRPLEVTRRRGAPGSEVPWYDFRDHLPGGVSNIAAQLSEAAQGIAKEYIKWAHTRPKDAEPDADGLADPRAAGRWRHFWIHRPRYERGTWSGACSYKTPLTCKLLKSVNNTGRPGEKFVVLRADFDVLEPQGRIRPHCHGTDAETLLLLPLLVPRLAPNRTAGTLAVGGEARPMVEGKVLLFDATFEHEEQLPKLLDVAEQGAETHDYGEELRAFYAAQGLPDKAAEIRDILIKWQGKEEKMMREVRKKYTKGWKGERVALRLLVRRSVLKSGSTEGEGGFSSGQSKGSAGKPKDQSAATEL